MTPREPTLPELRHAVSELFHPERCSMYRDHGGSLVLRILSSEFSGLEDPLERLTGRLLEEKGFRLPERTLSILKAPDDLEDEGEEELLFGRTRISTPNWGDALLLEPTEPPSSDDRDFHAEIVAFWGLKGGVGRSTALAHVAALLGNRRKILVVDLDLDSPALVASLVNGDRPGNPMRLEELVATAASSASDEDLQRQIAQALYRSSSTPSPIEVLGPYAADSAYVQSLLGPLAPSSLYRNGRTTLRRLIREAVTATSCDLVLLDARSGYCDESAMAVLDLADQVVIFASPTSSTFASFAPAVEALERHRAAYGYPSAVHYVAGMLPAGEEARERILGELQTSLEQIHAEVADTLQTPTEDLPPEIDLITVDYAARIVENEGIHLEHAGDGYRELAGRISPEPQSAGLRSLEPGWVHEVLKEAEIPVTQAEDESDPDLLARLFTGTRDLATFARQTTSLVLGAKGTGKSFLRRMCLHHQGLLVQRSGVQALRSVRFIDGYSQPRGGAGAQPPVGVDLLRNIDSRHGEHWSELWSALAWGRVAHDLGDRLEEVLQGHSRTQVQQLKRLAEAEDAKKILAELGRLHNDALGLDDAWRKLDRWCEEQDKSIVLLFDDLDVALGDEPKQIERRNVMIRGLLDRAAASWTSRRHLGVRIFLREDIFRGLGAQEQAKYETRSVRLLWKADDIWRLIIRALAVASPTFKEHIRSRGLDLEGLDEAPKDDWQEALELVWGERMGPGESHTRSITWAHKRLRDSQDRLFPRAALWLLRFAVEERRENLPSDTSPPLLDGSSLRAVMPQLSEQRLAELKAESTKTEKDRIGRLKGLDSYQNEESFLAALRDNGEPEPEEALRTLKTLGLTESGRRRDKTPTVRIVDLYAFAPELEINRRGRR